MCVRVFMYTVRRAMSSHIHVADIRIIRHRAIMYALTPFLSHAHVLTHKYTHMHIQQSQGRLQQHSTTRNAIKAVVIGPVAEIDGGSLLVESTGWNSQQSALQNRFLEVNLAASWLRRLATR